MQMMLFILHPYRFYVALMFAFRYRTQMMPMYKVGYKQVTELEWKCCPGYRGHDCMELKDVPSASHILPEPHLHPPSIPRQQPSVLGKITVESCDAKTQIC